MVGHGWFRSHSEPLSRSMVMTFKETNQSKTSFHLHLEIRGTRLWRLAFQEN